MRCRINNDGPVDISETLLPGVGLRYEFTTAHGEHIGLVVKRNGEASLLCYSSDDPDISYPVAQLTRIEAESVADILGAPRLAERFADLSREVPGLMAAQIEVGGSSRFAGRTIADTQARTRTGVSIVAIFDADGVRVAPGPDALLHAGCTLVVMGSEEGITSLQRLIAG